MAGMFSGHGHSHANGEECQGHGPPKDMPEEVRQKLLKQLEARMQEMQSSGGHGHGHSHGPGVSSLEPNPLKTSFNPFLYGYGHEPAPPPTGWDGLAKVASPAMESVDVGALGVRRDLSVRDNFWTVNVPVLGRLRVVKDGQGWVMASCVVLYWIYGNWSTWNAILLPYYYDGTMNLFFLLTYAFFSVMCIASFFRASTLNPGSLQTSQTPQDTWTDCHTCLQKRPPLCHHCRRCGQCVRKMDHHCPWINNCVGEENQFAFIQLLVYACLLSISTLALQAAHFFWLGGCKTCDQDSFVIYYRTPIILICVAMATVMLVSMVGLCLTQHISITHGTTTVEWMKLQQQIFVTGIIPENIGGFSTGLGGRSPPPDPVPLLALKWRPLGHMQKNQHIKRKLRNCQEQEADDQNRRNPAVTHTQSFAGVGAPTSGCFHADDAWQP